MPTLFILNGWKIQLYAREVERPHIHVNASGDNSPVEHLSNIQPQIVDFRPLGGGRIQLQFRHGPWVEVDLSYLIEVGGIFAPLADDEFLAQAWIGDYGHWIEWPGEVDQPADSLWLRGVPVAAPIPSVEVPAEPVGVR